MIVHGIVSEETPPLLASQYRYLWLESANELGLIAETLALVLGWQPTPDAPLPDALELAGMAATRIHELERVIGGARHRQPRRPTTAAIDLRVMAN